MKRYYNKIRFPPLNLQWLTNLPPAFVSAIIITVTSTAAVSMIFKGELAPYLPIGISCALIGAIIVNAISKFVCVFPFAVSCMTPNSAVVMGLFLMELSESGIPQEDVFHTIFAAFVLTCILTALLLFLVGFFNIGRLIRYMPYPVMCGFFAGVGWYLFLGAFTIVGVKTPFSALKTDFVEMAKIVGPAVGFAVMVFFVQKKFKNPYAYILMIALATLAFYGFLFWQGMDLEQVGQDRLTIQSPKIEFLFQHIHPSIFSHIHWEEIISRWGYVFSFAIVNLLSLLAYAVNFEETSHTSVDLDREVKFVGFSNLIGSVLTGGTSIFTTQSLTHRAAGASHSISVLYVSLFCILILFFSNHLIPYIPKFVVSGILITNGAFLIHKWLIKMARKISWEEWSIIAIIFGVMISQGFIQGVGVGLALAFLLFIFNNSKSQFIRYELSGEKLISNAFYSIQKLKALQKSGTQIHIIKLQGFFFFGTAERLHKHIKGDVLSLKDPQVTHLILDFSLVTDIDSTAIHSLLKLENVMQLRGCTLIMTNLNKRSRKHLGMAAKSYKKLEFLPYFKSMEVKTKKGRLYVFEDIDAGLEWAEKNIIKEVESQFQDSGDVETLGYSEFLETQEEIDLFLWYLTKIRLKKGENLVTPEHPDMSMYFIKTGHVAYLIRKGRGSGYKRIHEFGPGHLIGELQFYLERELENVKIDCIEECIFYKMDKKSYYRLERDHPEIALKFSKWILRIVSERLNGLTQEIKMLL